MKEIVVLRAIACLSVVLLHSIKFVVGFSYLDTGLIDFSLLTIAGLLAFGTAAFVFISQLLISYSYPISYPERFFTKRIKYILLPYLFMGMVYAIFYNLRNIEEFPVDFLYNIFGNYHGWFVLVIFQFYLIHPILVRLSKKYKAKNIIIATFFINIVYLGVFNFLSPVFENSFGNYMWDNGFMKLFPAWVFYFASAFYIGKNYVEAHIYLGKYKSIIILGIIFSSIIVIINNIFFDFGFGSKRVDMILFTTFLVLYLIEKLKKIENIPFFLKFISEYSFGIYLVHYIYLHIFDELLLLANIEKSYYFIPIYFFGSLAASILTVYIANNFSLGKYLVGKVKVNKIGLKKSNLL